MTKEQEPKIFDAKLSDLKPTAKNPRQLSEKGYRQLKKKMDKYPKFITAREVVIDEDFNILGGHQRVKVAEQRGDKTIRVKQVFGWTQEEKDNFIISDNVSEGDWDSDILANEWDSEFLEEWGVDVDWQEPQEVEEDEAPRVDESGEADSVQGKVYQLGEHRLMCGDSTDAASVAILMNGELADMVFTDPPYGVSYTEKNEFLNSLGEGHRLTKAIENDSKDPQEMYEFWVKAFSILHDFTKDTMAYYITAPQGGDLLLLLQAIRDSGFMLKHQLVWNKNNHVLGRCDYNYKHEPIIYGWKIGKQHNFYAKSKFKTSVWDIPKPLKSDLHPTMKPVELVYNAILDVTKEGDSVIDQFGGSGTTIIACEQTGRKARLMELDPYYCDVIRKRYWKFKTGSEEGWQDGTRAV